MSRITAELLHGELERLMDGSEGPKTVVEADEGCFTLRWKHHRTVITVPEDELQSATLSFVSAKYLHPAVERLTNPEEGLPDCPFSEGDIVRLRSGSPPLTVACVNDHFVLDVVWFRGARLQEATMPDWCFEMVSKYDAAAYHETVT